ncbi:MAG: hypothetical protein IKX54_01355 [Lachnospiraceae bacterium]|nr:hypothetical protein [Lachnospiraceae bacterium]
MKRKMRWRIVLILALAMMFVFCAAAHADEAGPTPTPTPTPTPVPGSPENVVTDPGGPIDDHVPTEEELAKLREDAYIEFLMTNRTDEIAGIWYEPKCPGIMYIGITDADVMEEILSGFENRDKIEVVLMKHSRRELLGTLNRMWDDKILSPTSVYAYGLDDRHNVIVVEFWRGMPEQEREQLRAEMVEKYGDYFFFTVGEYDLIDMRFNDDSVYETGDTPGAKEIGYSDPIVALPSMNFPVLKHGVASSADSVRRQANRTAMIAVAALLCAAVFGAAWVVRRQNLRAAVTTNGRIVASSGQIGNREIIAMAKAAEQDVSASGREKIFAAYEKERDNR